MPPLLRSILAIIIGGITAIIIVTLFDGLSLMFFPLPEGVDPNDMTSAVANVSAIPAGSFVVLIVGWGAASLTGAWLAARLAARAPLVHGLVVAGLMLITGILNLLSLPHPVWVWVFGSAAYIGGGYVGARLGANREADDNDLQSMTP